jgi:hypothetical protein
VGGQRGFHWNGVQTKVHENRVAVIKFVEWAAARGHVHTANKDIRATAFKRNSNGPIPLSIFWQSDEQNSFTQRPPENRLTDNYRRTQTLRSAYF